MWCTKACKLLASNYMQYSELRRACILELFFNCFQYQEVSCLVAVSLPSFCNAFLFPWQQLQKHHGSTELSWMRPKYIPGFCVGTKPTPDLCWLRGLHPPCCTLIPPCRKKRAPSRWCCSAANYTPTEIILTLNYHLFGFPMPRCLLSGWQCFSQKARGMQPFLLNRSLPFRILCAVCTHRRDGEL